MLYKKYLFALLKKYKWFYLAMIILAALSMSLLFGVCSAFEGYEDAYNDFLDTCGYADIVIDTDTVKRDKLEEVEKIDGVDNINVRAAVNCTMKADTRLLTIKLVTKPSENVIIDTYFVDETEKSTETYNVILERNFAENNNIKVGDSVYIKVNGEFYECFVYALVQSPETTFFQVTSFMTADNRDSGCVYMDESECYEFLNDNGLSYLKNMANELLVDVEDGADVASVMTSCEELLEKNNVDILSSESGKDIPYLRNMNNYLNNIGNVCVLVPIIFYTITLVVSLLFLIQIVKNSYKEIGILMMLGYKKSQIISLFSLCSLFISFLSSILGTICGIWLMHYISNVFQTGDIIPYTFEIMDIRLLVLGVIITIVVGQVACLLSSIQLRSLTPVDVWSDDRQTKINNGNGKTQNRLPISLVLAINGLRRNSQGFFVSVFAFVATYVLIFMALSIDLGIDTTVNQLTDKRLNYDAQVVLLEEDDSVYDSLCNSEFLETIEKTGIGSTTIKSGSLEETSNFEVLTSNHKFIPVFDKNNEEELEIPEDGIILDYSVAERLGVSVGSTVEVNGKEVKIASISAMYGSKMIIMSYETADELGLDYYETFVVDVSSEEKLLNFFEDESASTFTMFSRNLGDSVHEDSDTFKVCTRLIIIFAILIGVTIICIVNVSSFNEQKRRLSIMRVLGFTVFDISNLWLIQFLISLALSLVLSIPVGCFASATFLDSISGMLYTYPFINEPQTYLVTIGLIIAFYLVAHVVTIQTVRRFNLADNTRSRE